MPKAVTKLTTETGTLPRTYRLRIFQDGDKFKVRYGTLVVDVGDKLEWESRDTAATVMFPIINGVSVVLPNPVPIGNGGIGSAVVQDVTNVPKTSFGDVDVAYAVYCEETNNFAEGNSDPKIIVKGP